VSIEKKMDVFMHNMSSERTNKRNKTKKNCSAPREWQRYPFINSFLELKKKTFEYPLDK
jgi:hypothetical protein